MKSDLFRILKFIKEVDLEINNLVEFFHSTSDNKWMSSINQHQFMDLSVYKNGTKYPNKTESTEISSKMIVLRLQDRYDNYEYPNEDICLFRHFPHNQLVFFNKIFGSNYLKSKKGWNFI